MLSSVICIGGKRQKEAANLKMAVKRDSRGHIIGKCKPRFNPMKKYRKDEFQARFRLSKKIVRSIARKLRPYSSVKGMSNAGGLSLPNRVALALRYFATGGRLTMCGDTQHVSNALVSRAVRDVSNFFYATSSDYIRWPKTTAEKGEKATLLFRHKDQKTPRVFGMVDGTHIAIHQPVVNESCFVNRKNYHSINTTIISDFDRKIMYVDPRFCGSVGDAYALHCSPVGDQIRVGEVDDHGPLGKFVLLGDSGYGLKRNLFTPYRGTVTPKQEKFNKWHRKNRVRVEQTIGVLKQRWRCLDSSGGYLYHEPSRAAKVIVTCCCLHNIALDHGIRLTNHPDDPWVPRQRRLPQPAQRSQNTQRERRKEIKKVRDDYCDRYF